MQVSNDERRKSSQRVSFPFRDSHGKLVKSERRSGKDRRRHKRHDDVASDILSIFH